LEFFAQTTASFCKNVIMTLVFRKKKFFFAENDQKSQKIEIIDPTSLDYQLQSKNGRSYIGSGDGNNRGGVGLLHLNIFLPDGSAVGTGPNPTIASYNASVVIFYNATGSLVCLENKKFV
jgi:hypothetical protein